MTNEEKLQRFHVLIGDTKWKEDQDTLSVYLELAGAKILERLYPFRDNWDGLKVPDKYSMLQLKIGCYMWGKRGAEGQIQHIENGIHRNYGDADIPENMLADIVPYAQAIR